MAALKNFLPPRLRESVWLQHPRIWIGAGLLWWAVMACTWVIGRVPPTSIVGFDVTGTRIVGAGENANVTVLVNRDLSRICSVETSRRFVDASLVNTDTVPYSFASYTTIEQREKDDPGRIRLSLEIPRGAAAGMGRSVTENRYTCLFNPTTWFVPIEQTWEVPIYVVPKVMP